MSQGAPRTLGPVTGKHRRAVLLCRFATSDSPSPKTKGYFEGMFKDPDSGLLAFFEEASYGRLNMSAKVHDWLTLPQNQDYYEDKSDVLFDDCTKVHHDAGVDFGNFTGIDIIADDRIGSASLGGSHCGTAGDVTKCWPTTWIASRDDQPDEEALWAHEMGHSLALPHTTGLGPFSHYWDPLSAPGLWCFINGATDPDYLCLPTHFMAAHKDRYEDKNNHRFGLGWIPGARRFVAKKGESKTVMIERLARPRDNDNYLIARVPVPGRDFYYTAETRIRAGRFDSLDNLPGDGVIISKVDWDCTGCPTYTPVRVVGKDKNGDHFLDPATALWRPGETFRLDGHGLRIAILSKNRNHAYKVKISLDD